MELSTALVRLLSEKGLTISTAESCTGGLIAKCITDVSGASAVFYGGVVSYDNSVKENVLSVNKDILNSLGAVSAPVACQMASGVKRIMKTDIGISTTGIAGPGGGTPEKPVGMVCFGFYIDGKTMTTTRQFGDLGRDAVRIASVEYVYSFLATMLPRLTGMKFQA
jgi:PncC family amidohydrolase